MKWEKIMVSLVIGIVVVIIIGIICNNVYGEKYFKSTVVEVQKESGINNNVIDNSNDTVVNNKVEENKNSEISEEYNYLEEAVVNYFDSELENISSYSKTLFYREKAKDLFITVVDFLFYNKEIKGYTFSELSDSTKLKVLDIAFKMDSKIEGLFPGYKDSLVDKYKYAKDTIVTKYLEITVKICSNSEEYCDKAKDVWGTIKEKAGLSWEVIKEYAGKGISNLKDWYEVYSGK